ncbi:MAG: 1-acyl-sn-glycerol-3-phosphate acyltransferase [Candidatus Poseidoniaceae archaeon]|nr:1-acyl-sn-glycerol-3-phosphate acyltransferase [Candidatus Poseidoniaceae archaeon]|tara:strand:+ start:6577 stop:8208 length:1632 start_codon:yes stop_codon:yes gene_type:complete
MNHPDPSELYDGAVDHRGDALPYLSKSAKNMKMEELLNTPMPKYSGSTPGSYFWTKVLYWICRRISAVQFRTHEATGVSNIPLNRGTLCCAWHTNGLLDALQITLNHPKYFVLGARHDLVTRPMLGWWTRKMAVQPVVRKAELLRGGCSEEEANFLNGRSLLTLASGIAHGFGCVLFPEGTSHNNSYMLRFRTGPVRTVLAAGALASSLDKDLPALIPIGLHFRVREHFRTDIWVEYGAPIQVTKDDIPSDLIEAVSKGSWSEPPAEIVFQLRDKLRLEMEPLTPNVAEWEEHRALHLLGHVEQRRNNTPPGTWRKEVLAARDIQNRLVKQKRVIVNDEPKPDEIEHPIIKPAVSAAKILQENNLDGRDLNSKGTDLRFANLSKLPISLARSLGFIALLPLFLLSLAPQVILGRLLGDSTDEGVDARTSYQFLAAMFGSLLIWPIASTIAVIIIALQEARISDIIEHNWTDILGQGAFFNGAMYCIAWLLFMPLFWLSGRLGSLAWDDYTYLRKFVIRQRMKKSTRQNLRALLNNIHEELPKI